MKDILNLRVNDKIWLSKIGQREVWVDCPVCYGKKKVTLILGNDEQAVLDCGYCERGWESPSGKEMIYKFVAEPEEITISGVSSNEREGKREVSYYYNGNYHVGPEKLFNTKEEAEVECQKAIKEHHEEQLRQLGHKNVSSRRKFGWNAGYYIRKLNDLKKEMARYEEKIQIIRVKKKEVEIEGAQ